MRIVLDILKIKNTLVTPNFQKHSKYWSECSNLCHIGWTFACNDPQFRTNAFQSLCRIHEFLTEQIYGLARWPKIEDDSFADLRDRFVAGSANSEDVREFLEKSGAWTRVKYEDGRPSKFLGEAIPPDEVKKSNC